MRVQLRQIALSIAGRSVLEGLDLSTDENEYVVILGPSGCGKTSTLRIIAGLQKADRGEVRFNDTPVTAKPPRERGVAMVFQHDALYPHLTVEKSILLGLGGGTRDPDLSSRLKAAAEMTQIAGLLDRFPDQLSGGELRRAAVAKAIVRRSPVRLLDEPLSALDASARHLLQDDLLRWHRKVPGTTIHVTHDGYEAMRMADRMAILHQGRIVQFDSPDKIYHEPTSLAAACAIGSPSMNLFPARIESNSLVMSDPRIRVALEHSSFGPDCDVVLGVRPESLRAVSGEEPSLRGLQVTANPVEIRRDIYGWRVRAEIDQLTIHGEMNNAVTDGLSDSEKTIRLRADESQLHLFDASTGQRLKEIGAT